MVGFGLDLTCRISGHHCTGFTPCSGMDASQKQPGSVLGRRPLPSDSSAGVCSMEHALTSPAVAPMAEAGSRDSIDCWRPELCRVLQLSGSAGHQFLVALCAAERRAYCCVVVLRFVSFQAMAA